MNSEFVKQFYNTHFFDSRQQAREVLCSVTFRCGSEELVIPAINLRATNTIDSIVKSFYEFLQAGGVPAEPASPISSDSPPAAPESGGVVDRVPGNVEQIKYRNFFYLVEQYGEDEFVVKNKDKEMKVIDPRSPTAKAIIKRYRKTIE